MDDAPGWAVQCDICNLGETGHNKSQIFGRLGVDRKIEENSSTGAVSEWTVEAKVILEDGSTITGTGKGKRKDAKFHAITAILRLYNNRPDVIECVFCNSSLNKIKAGESSGPTYTTYSEQLQYIIRVLGGNVHKQISPVGSEVLRVGDFVFYGPDPSQVAQSYETVAQVAVEYFQRKISSIIESTAFLVCEGALYTQLAALFVFLKIPFEVKMSRKYVTQDTGAVESQFMATLAVENSRWHLSEMGAKDEIALGVLTRVAAACALPSPSPFLLSGFLGFSQPVVADIAPVSSSVGSGRGGRHGGRDRNRSGREGNRDASREGNSDENNRGGRGRRQEGRRARGGSSHDSRDAGENTKGPEGAASRQIGEARENSASVRQGEAGDAGKARAAGVEASEPGDILGDGQQQESKLIGLIGDDGAQEGGGVNLDACGVAGIPCIICEKGKNPAMHPLQLWERLGESRRVDEEETTGAHSFWTATAIITINRNQIQARCKGRKKDAKSAAVIWAMRKVNQLVSKSVCVFCRQSLSDEAGESINEPKKKTNRLGSRRRRILAARKTEPSVEPASIGSSVEKKASIGAVNRGQRMLSRKDFRDLAAPSKRQALAKPDSSSDSTAVTGAALPTELSMTNANNPDDAGASSPRKTRAKRKERGEADPSSLAEFEMSSKKQKAPEESKEAGENTEEPSPDDQRAILGPRVYQTQIFERAKHENVIAFLPTGTGKTYISWMVIKHAIETHLGSGPMHVPVKANPVQKEITHEDADAAHKKVESSEKEEQGKQDLNKKIENCEGQIEVDSKATHNTKPQDVTNKKGESSDTVEILVGDEQSNKAKVNDKTQSIKKSDKPLVIFLAPTVSLVLQQTAVFKALLDDDRLNWVVMAYFGMGESQDIIREHQVKEIQLYQQLLEQIGEAQASAPLNTPSSSVAVSAAASSSNSGADSTTSVQCDSNPAISEIPTTIANLKDQRGNNLASDSGQQGRNLASNSGQQGRNLASDLVTVTEGQQARNLASDLHAKEHKNKVSEKKDSASNDLVSESSAVIMEDEVPDGVKSIDGISIEASSATKASDSENNPKVPSDNPKAIPNAPAVPPVYIGEREKRWHRKFWDKNWWQQEFERVHIMTMTPQVFLNILSHQFLGPQSLGRITLVVFDECHHAVGKRDIQSDPYSEITKHIRAYHRGLGRDTESRSIFAHSPKFFGMTASPAAAQLKDLPSVGVVMESLRRLEDKLMSVALTVPPEEMADYIRDAKDEIVLYRPTMEVTSNLKHASHVQADLGPWAYRIVTEVYSQRLLAESRPQTTLDQDLALAAQTHQYTEAEGTSKLNKMLNILRSHIKVEDSTKSTPAISGIVFVQRKVTARVVTALINSLPELRNHYIAHALTGHSDDNEEGMSIREQKMVLERFREGKINLLVATKVAQEGLDIRTCRMVIMFDPPVLLADYIQSRGRARDVDSKYFVLTPDTHDWFLDRAQGWIRALTNAFAEKEDFADPNPHMPDEEEQLLLGDKRVVFTGPHARSVVARLCQCSPADQFARRQPEYLQIDLDNPQGQLLYLAPYSPLVNDDLILELIVSYLGDELLFTRKSRQERYACRLELPLHIPVPENFRVIVGAPRSRKRVAQSSAALRCCQMLYNLKILDDNVLPVRAVGGIASAAERRAKKNPLGAKIRHQQIIQPRVLASITSTNEVWYLHAVDFDPKVSLGTPPSKTCVSPIEDTQQREPQTCFLLLLPNKLDPYSVTVDVSGSVHVTSVFRYLGEISLTAEQRNMLRRFHMWLRRCIWHPSATTLKKHEPIQIEHSLDDDAHFLALGKDRVNGSEEILDWNLMQNCYEFRKLQLPASTLTDRDGAVVFPPHSGTLFHVEEISELTARAPFPDTQYPSFESYYKTKYQLEISEEDACAPLWKGTNTRGARIYSQSRFETTPTLHSKWRTILVGKDTGKVDFVEKILLRRLLQQNDENSPQKLLQERLQQREKDLIYHLPCLCERLWLSPWLVCCAQIIPSMIWKLCTHLLVSQLQTEINLLPEEQYLEKYRQALTSTNGASGPWGIGMNYERMESFGDAILKLITSYDLYVRFPHGTEGILTLERSKLVSNPSLYARALGLPKKKHPTNNSSEEIQHGEEEPKADEDVEMKLDSNESHPQVPPGEPKEIPLATSSQGSPTEEVPAPASTESLQAEHPIEKKTAQETQAESAEKKTGPNKKQMRKKYNGLAGYLINYTLDRKTNPIHPSLWPHSERQRLVPDKQVADVVEALIGMHYVIGRDEGTLTCMEWMGFSVSMWRSPHSHHSKALARQPSLRAQLSPERSRVIATLGEWVKNTFGGYQFKDVNLLITAFTHASILPSDCLTGECYQRLEFLGDAVLDFLVTRHIFEKFHDLPPGMIHHLKSHAVCNDTLAKVAVEIGAYEHLQHFNFELTALIKNFVEVHNKRKESTGGIQWGSDAESTSRQKWVPGEDDDDVATEPSDEGQLLDEARGPVLKVLGDVIESVIGALFLDLNRDLDALWTMMKLKAFGWVDASLTPEQVPLNPISELLHTVQTLTTLTVKIKREPNLGVWRAQIGDIVIGEGRHISYVRARRLAAMAGLAYLGTEPGRKLLLDNSKSKA